VKKEDRNTGYYGTRFAFDKKRQYVWKVLARWIQKRFIPPGSDVLDLGCGYCGFINNVKAGKKYGLDASPVSRRYADRDVVLKIGDAARSMADCKAGCVDTVFASNFFEHLDEASFDRVLAGVKRALKPGGRLILVQPNFRYAYRNYFDDYTHKLIFTHTGLCDRLAAEGFVIEACRPRFLPFTVKSAMGAFYWLIGPYLALPFKLNAGQMLIVAKKSKV
jgi:SAM-dependent methyltransferase